RDRRSGRQAGPARPADEGILALAGPRILASDRRFDLELELELGCQLREAAQVFLELRRLAGLLAEDDLLIYQNEDLLCVPQARLLREIGLDRRGLTLTPGPALMLQQQGQEQPVGPRVGPGSPARNALRRLRIVGFDHDQSSRPSCPETRSSARDSFRRR